MSIKESHKNTHIYQNAVILFLIIVMAIFAFIDFNFLENELDQNMIRNSILRFLGGTIFTIILIGFGQKKIFRFTHVWKSLLIMIPAFVVSINNFPIIAYLDGRATLTHPVYQVYLFLIECFSVGFFEEILIRGIILIYLLKKLSYHQYGVILSIIISSAIFGFLHIVNLWSGQSVGDTMLQIIYSFLVGMMWAIMFLKTRNLWLTMILHASFNFFGQVMFYLGNVDGRYDIYTVLLTIMFGLIAAYYSFLLYKQFKEQITLDFT